MSAAGSFAYTLDNMGVDEQAPNEYRPHSNEKVFNVPVPPRVLRPVDGRLRVGQVPGKDPIGVLLLGSKGLVKRPEMRMRRCGWKRDVGTPAAPALESERARSRLLGLHNPVRYAAAIVLLRLNASGVADGGGKEIHVHINASFKCRG